MREEWGREFAARAKAYWTDDRLKKLIGDRRPPLLPSEAPLLLRALGLLHRDASMPPDRVRKFRQINHMLAVLQPSLASLNHRFETVRVLDAACGRSYLSTLIAWHVRHNWDHPIRVLGVDRGEAMIEESRKRAQWIGLQDVLRFAAADLESLDVGRAFASVYPGTPDDGGVEVVLSLHGCNTATDEAIVLGLRTQATLIAVVPCCQAELSQRWLELSHGEATGAFEPLWKTNHLRQVTAAHVTDLMRMLLLRAAGYATEAIEFVPMEHTPKNTLIRAMKTGRGPDPEAAAQYLALRASTGGVGIGLEERVGVEALRGG